MKDIISRLVADLRWRLSAAGRKYKPAAQERNSWGAARIPWLVPVLLWGAYVSFSVLGADFLRPVVPEWLFFLLFDWPCGILSGVLLFMATGRLNRLFLIRAYENLLSKNERFTLVEYTKYLRRQIKRAMADPALGGPAEVRRLEQLLVKLRALLLKGAGQQALPVESTLSQEADFAEAVVQAYGELGADPLQELDQRLPAELRQRVEELEREVEAGQRAAETERG